MVRPLSIQDLEFANTVVEGESASGVRFTRLVRTGMPKIPNNVLRCVFFLYDDEAAARDGVDPQATGFLVCMPAKGSTTFSWHQHVYAVTNWHNVWDDSDPDDPPSPAIRIDMPDGEPYIAPLKKEDWRFIPGGGDVAVAPLLDIGSNRNILCVPSGLFLRERDIKQHDINIGDDVFMMGLFVDHDKVSIHIPKARFGNVSMMPTDRALLEQDNTDHGQAPAFVLDVHSRTGFSGSPVFVYRTFGSDLTKPVGRNFSLEVGRSRSTLNDLPEIKLTVKQDTLFGLLGIHYAQFPEEIEVGGVPAEGLSGMTLVCPAWHILDVLNSPALVEMREETERRMEKEDRKKPRPEKASRKPRANSEEDEPNPNHRADLKRLLGAAATKPKSSG